MTRLKLFKKRIFHRMYVIKEEHTDGGKTLFHWNSVALFGAFSFSFIGVSDFFVSLARRRSISWSGMCKFVCFSQQSFRNGCARQFPTKTSWTIPSFVCDFSTIQTCVCVIQSSSIILGEMNNFVTSGGRCGRWHLRNKRDRIEN